MSQKSCSGVTMIELMVVLVVMTILATIAIPSFQEIRIRNEITSQNNELVALIHMARNEAIRRNPLGVGADTTVRVELRPDGASWAGNVRPPGNTDPVAGCPQGAVRCSAGVGARLSGALIGTESGGGDAPISGDINLYFDNRGYSVDSNGVNLAPGVRLNLLHVNCTNAARHARDIRVLPTGQVVSEPGQQC